MRQFATHIESAALSSQRDVITSSIDQIERKREELVRRRNRTGDPTTRRMYAWLIKQEDESLRILQRQVYRHNEQARRVGHAPIEYRHEPVFLG